MVVKPEDGFPKKSFDFAKRFKNWIRIKTLSVNLTQEKIKKQSDIETDKPVSSNRKS
jgi:hypothetical protein